MDMESWISGEKSGKKARNKAIAAGVLLCMLVFLLFFFTIDGERARKLAGELRGTDSGADTAVDSEKAEVANEIYRNVMEKTEFIEDKYINGLKDAVYNWVDDWTVPTEVQTSVKSGPAEHIRSFVVLGSLTDLASQSDSGQAAVFDFLLHGEGKQDNPDNGGSG